MLHGLTAAHLLLSPPSPFSLSRHVQQLRLREPRPAQWAGPVGALQVGGGEAGQLLHCEWAAPAATHRGPRRACAPPPHQRG